LSIDCPDKFAVDPLNQMKLSQFLFKDRSLSLSGLWVRNAVRSLLKNQRQRFFEIPSDDFFSRHSQLLEPRGVDLAFIDGLHTYEQALRDALNCARYLRPGGVIVMHDCNPATAAIETPAPSFEAAEAMKVPSWDGLWCGDVWKAIVHMRALHPELDAFVLDCDFGVGIVVKSPTTSKLSYTEADIRRMSYRDLESRRAELLSLRSPDTFKTFLNARQSLG